MKIKIKSFNGELPEYVKPETVYEDIGYYVNGDFFFKVENGQVIPINSNLKNCRHLNGGSWEVVDEHTD